MAITACASAAALAIFTSIWALLPTAEPVQAAPAFAPAAPQETILMVALADLPVLLVRHLATSMGPHGPYTRITRANGSRCWQVRQHEGGQVQENLYELGADGSLRIVWNGGGRIVLPADAAKQ